MLMGAKDWKIKSEYADEYSNDDDGEGIIVRYWVGEEEGLDRIAVEDGGEFQWHPVLAGVICQAIEKARKWAASAKGQKEILRLRSKVIERMSA